MNLVFVNHLHPESGVVGAVRLWRLATELSARGHRVVYLCAPCEGEREGAEPFSRWREHDWRQPFVVACGPSPRATRRGQGNRRFSLVRQFSTAWNLVARGGPFPEWRNAARHAGRSMPGDFKADLCYATFGNLDALNIARDIARARRVPWLFDIKDPGDKFLPHLLRPLLTRRYKDAAAVTLNAEYQRRHNPGWPVKSAPVLYSGVDQTRPPVTTVNPRRYLLVGSLYSDVLAARLFQAFHEFAIGSSTRPSLIYAGSDSDRVERIFAAMDVRPDIDVRGQLPAQELIDLAGQSAGVLYVSSDSTFHHKVLELGVLGRPLIGFGHVCRESIALAERHGLPLTICANEEQLVRALAKAPATATREMSEAISRLSWRVVAQELERLFEGVLATGEASTTAR